MQQPPPPAKPAWQTGELEEEWIDLDDEPSGSEQQATPTQTTSDLSFTETHGAILAIGHEQDQSNASSVSAAGTVLIREDMPAVPILPQTPGGAKKGLSKNFFSPLALEQMFEPPSPPSNDPHAQAPNPHTNAPSIPSRLSRMYIPEEDMSAEAPSGIEFDDDENEAEAKEEAGDQSHTREDMDRFGPEDTSRTRLDTEEFTSEVTNYQFTFAAPGLSNARLLRPSPAAPITPQPMRTTPLTAISHLPVPPATDPRLRLFQFQYDTFTRDHLSAMVDSFALHSPAGGSNTANSRDSSPALPSFASPSDGSISRLRSAKRIKLSPASDFSGDGDALIIRSQNYKDYVGESRSLMDKIRQARDFSTVSTRATSLTPFGSESHPVSVHRHAFQSDPGPTTHLAIPTDEGGRINSSSWPNASSKRLAYSSVQYREQAADLMAQIRHDVRSHKRLFSGEAEQTPVRQGGGLEQEQDSAESVEIEPIDYGGDTEPISDPDDDAYAPSTNAATVQPTQNLWGPGRTDNAVEELTGDMSQVSLDSESLMEQFPPLPVVLVMSTSSTSSSRTTRDVALSEEQKAARPTYLAPHSGGIALAYPSTSQRLGVSEDLNRFVSSSTTASGSIITNSSSSTLVKHEHSRPIKLITPDSQTIPDRLGEMVFDQEQKRWVKASRVLVPSGTMRTSGSMESEDPFRDIESLHEDSTRTAEQLQQDAQPVSDVESSMDLDASQTHHSPSDSESEDEEEAQLTSFSFDGRSLPSVEPPANDPRKLAIDSVEDDTARKSEGTGQFATSLAESFSREDPGRNVVAHHQQEPALQDTPPHQLAPSSSNNLTTPLPSQSSLASAPTSGIRSAMKSNSTITPVSAMKDPSRGRTQTPANRLIHRRSVSFSDGKREGPIVGIGRNIPTPDVTTESDGGSSSDVGSIEPSAPLDPSARSKRIADMLEDLEDTSYDEGSPSKASSVTRPAAEELRPLGKRQNTTLSNPSARVRPRRAYSQSHSTRSLKSTGNATFLTECSFGVAHDRLVQVITDVQPFEPYWESLSSIDLSRKGLDSVARLKEFLPKLDSLVLNFNQLSWLSGIPAKVRALSVASNSLTSVTSFSHLTNLESLDISRNNIDSLRQLACLRHLRELRADGNMIDSVDGLQKMDGLVKLSLQGNNIESIDLASYRWSRLEMLNLSQNRLGRIAGISAQSLPSLIAFNLDHNHLRELEVEGTMGRLKILRVSGNRLQQFNAGPFPSLRTLYADNNSLGPVLKAHRLTKLENLSLRNQSGRAGLSLSIHDVRDVKRLYLSGNPMKPGFISEPCYNLIYLELAACRLTTLPTELSRFTPNLRVLNLNYNFLEDVRPLQGLTRLRKLTIIGSRVKASRDFVRMLKGMLDVEMLDLRMNPCTLGWYLPLLVKDVPGALQPSDGDRHLLGPSSAAASRTEFNVSARPDAARSNSNSNNGINKARGANGASSDDQLNQHQGANPTAAASADPCPPPAPTASRARSSTVGARGGSHRGPRHALVGGTEEVSWKDLDSKFRRDLPDEAYVGRLAYRGLVMRACPAIRMLDGLEVSEKEKEKAERLLESVLDNRKKRQLAAHAPAKRPASSS